MVLAKKQQEKEEIPENVKSWGGETIVSWKEILRWMAKKGVSPSQICCTVAEQSPLTTYMLQNPRGLVLMADHWGAASTLNTRKKIKIDGSIPAWDSGEKEDCLA